jgi:hypothetical protein
MKTMLFALVAISLTSGTYAQTDSTGGKMSPPDIHNNNDGMQQNQNLNNDKNQSISQQPDSLWKLQTENKLHTDGVTMQNGKLMIVKDRKMNLLDKNITMHNGTKVMSDGYYMLKGGTKVKLKEGEHIDMFGNLSPINNSTPKTE